MNEELAKIKKTCGNCAYYVPEPSNLKVGSCRRFPPQRGWNYHTVPLSGGRIGETQMAQMPDTDFPIVLPASWCGEFKATGIGELKGNG